MTGLIVLELMMIRQTEMVEGGQDVQYIDSWGEAGWRRRSVLGSWTVKLLPFQTPSVRLIPRVVSKIPSMIGPNCQGKGRTRWRTKLRCRTMLLRGQSTRLSCPPWARPHPGRRAAVTGRGYCGSQLRVLLGLLNVDRRARGAAMETWLPVMDLSHSRVVDAVVFHAGHSVSSFWDSC